VGSVNRLGDHAGAELSGAARSSRPSSVRSIEWIDRHENPVVWRGRFVYPPAVAVLDGHRFAERPGSMIRLPKVAADLECDARYMGNCIAGYRSGIGAGERFILIVDDECDPDVAATQKRLNLEIIADSVSLRRNQHIGNFSGEPAWLRQALHRCPALAGER
jgi:hypothetical protein